MYDTISEATFYIISGITSDLWHDIIGMVIGMTYGKTFDRKSGMTSDITYWMSSSIWDICDIKSDITYDII